jgi:ABC-type uncharacterized transport system ATPase subunit
MENLVKFFATLETNISTTAMKEVDDFLEQLDRRLKGGRDENEALLFKGVAKKVSFTPPNFHRHAH